MTASAIAPHLQQFDLPRWLRVAAASAAMMLFSLCVYAIIRWTLGFAPETPWVRNAALIIHLVTVIPAIPLGAYVVLSRKGGVRHKSLGKIWLTLMFVTAISTVFIRNVNDGQFSWIHLFTLLTFVAVPQAIISARQGRIDAHKKHLRNFFIGALVIAGLTAFAPGRTMWQWAFGNPNVTVWRAEVAPPHGNDEPDAGVRLPLITNISSWSAFGERRSIKTAHTEFALGRKQNGS